MNALVFVIRLYVHISVIVIDCFAKENQHPFVERRISGNIYDNMTRGREAAGRGSNIYTTPNIKSNNTIAVIFLCKYFQRIHFDRISSRLSALPYLLYPSFECKK